MNPKHVATAAFVPSEARSPLAILAAIAGRIVAAAYGTGAPVFDRVHVDAEQLAVFGYRNEDTDEECTTVTLDPSNARAMIRSDYGYPFAFTCSAVRAALENFV